MLPTSLPSRHAVHQPQKQEHQQQPQEQQQQQQQQQQRHQQQRQQQHRHWRQSLPRLPRTPSPQQQILLTLLVFIFIIFIFIFIINLMPLPSALGAALGEGLPDQQLSRREGRRTGSGDGGGGGSSSSNNNNDNNNNNNSNSNNNNSSSSKTSSKSVSKTVLSSSSSSRSLETCSFTQELSLDASFSTSDWMSSCFSDGENASDSPTNSDEDDDFPANQTATRTESITTPTSTSSTSSTTTTTTTTTGKGDTGAGQANINTNTYSNIKFRSKSTIAATDSGADISSSSSSSSSSSNIAIPAATSVASLASTASLSKVYLSAAPVDVTFKRETASNSEMMQPAMGQVALKTKTETAAETGTNKGTETGTKTGRTADMSAAISNAETLQPMVEGSEDQTTSTSSSSTLSATTTTTPTTTTPTTTTTAATTAEFNATTATTSTTSTTTSTTASTSSSDDVCLSTSDDGFDIVVSCFVCNISLTREDDESPQNSSENSSEDDSGTSESSSGESSSLGSSWGSSLGSGFSLLLEFGHAIGPEGFLDRVEMYEVYTTTCEGRSPGDFLLSVEAIEPTVPITCCDGRTYSLNISAETAQAHCGSTNALQLMVLPVVRGIGLLPFGQVTDAIAIPGCEVTGSTTTMTTTTSTSAAASSTSSRYFLGSQATTSTTTTSTTFTTTSLSAFDSEASTAAPAEVTTDSPTTSLGVTTSILPTTTTTVAAAVTTTSTVTTRTITPTTIPTTTTTTTTTTMAVVGVVAAADSSLSDIELLAIAGGFALFLCVTGVGTVLSLQSLANANNNNNNNGGGRSRGEDQSQPSVKTGPPILDPTSPRTEVGPYEGELTKGEERPHDAQPRVLQESFNSSEIPPPSSSPDRRRTKEAKVGSSSKRKERHRENAGINNSSGNNSNHGNSINNGNGCNGNSRRRERVPRDRDGDAISSNSSHSSGQLKHRFEAQGEGINNGENGNNSNNNNNNSNNNNNNNNNNSNNSKAILFGPDGRRRKPGKKAHISIAIAAPIDEDVGQVTQQGRSPFAERRKKEEDNNNKSKDDNSSFKKRAAAADADVAVDVDVDAHGDGGPLGSAFFRSEASEKARRRGEEAALEEASAQAASIRTSTPKTRGPATVFAAAAAAAAGAEAQAETADDSLTILDGVWRHEDDAEKIEVIQHGLIKVNDKKSIKLKAISNQRLFLWLAGFKLTGEYTQDRIEWEDGTCWVRSKETHDVSHLEGRWDHSAGGIVEIVRDGDHLNVTNPRTGSHRLHIEDFHQGDTAILYFGHVGAFENDVIRWTNGSLWTKIPSHDVAQHQSWSAGPIADPTASGSPTGATSRDSSPIPKSISSPSSLARAGQRYSSKGSSAGSSHKVFSFGSPTSRGEAPGTNEASPASSAAGLGSPPFGVSISLPGGFSWLEGMSPTSCCDPSDRGPSCSPRRAASPGGVRPTDDEPLELDAAKTASAAGSRTPIVAPTLTSGRMLASRSVDSIPEEVAATRRLWLACAGDKKDSRSSSISGRAAIPGPRAAAQASSPHAPTNSSNFLGLQLSELKACTPQLAAPASKKSTSTSTSASFSSSLALPAQLCQGPGRLRSQQTLPWQSPALSHSVVAAAATAPAPAAAAAAASASPSPSPSPSPSEAGLPDLLAGLPPPSRSSNSSSSSSSSSAPATAIAAGAAASTHHHLHLPSLQRPSPAKERRQSLPAADPGLLPKASGQGNCITAGQQPVSPTQATFTSPLSNLLLPTAHNAGGLPIRCTLEECLGSSVL